jgi:hypothetical protein
VVVAVGLQGLCLTARSQDPPPPRSPQKVSGIYPHLAMFNNEQECGTGAVVPWADRLWVITYAPHKPRGSSDKLYEIDASLSQVIRPESIGGTPANRLIHRESQQLFLGPYVIDKQRNVRVIPYAQMFGRPTGTARHLKDPANFVYCATMEEGLYEIDVKTLAVTELWADEQQQAGRHSDLPGYHGKGLYSGQGRVIYSNNGEHGARALKDPATPSGVLAEWDGKAEEWTVVRRSQFTEVTGPGGIYGNAKPSTDVIWAMGWDHRSLLLQVLDGGTWHSYRLPKGSHSYDGAHGWNTEWPRIREIGEPDLLMTMHGLFWRFPRDFRAGAAGGIRARSAYLKVVGDFCSWQDQVVLGCDDTARSGFLDMRAAKDDIAAPRSQSNLWFLAPEQLDQLGPVRAVGGLWTHEDIAAGTVSEPFLVAGFDLRGLHLAHAGTTAATVVVEIDADGSGTWREWQKVQLSPQQQGGYRWLRLPPELAATWLRVRTAQDLTGAVAYAHFANRYVRSSMSGDPFAAWNIERGHTVSGGLVRARGGNKTSLAYAAQQASIDGVVEVGCYELDVKPGGTQLQLLPTEDAGLQQHTLQHAAIIHRVLTSDDASIILLDDESQRWRVPRAAQQANSVGFGLGRGVREVATERDLLHVAGTFFELPANNAGGYRKLRPVASHEFFVHDFCSYRGLLVMTGVDAATPTGRNIVQSADGKAALWVGAIDDLWQLGRPRGRGGPWWHSQVQANVASDPFLATGYENRTGLFAHDRDHAVTFTMAADLCGDGQWVDVHAIEVPAMKTVEYALPPAWSAYWIRMRASEDCRADAMFLYQ